MTTIDLGKIMQGERGTGTYTWIFPDNLTSPASILSAAITAVMRNIDTGAVTAVTGTLTGTAATTFTWARSAADSGTAGAFAVVFRAVVGGVDTYTLDAHLVIADNPAVDTVAGPALVGVATDDAAWLAASEAGGALGTAAYQAATAFATAGDLDDLEAALIPVAPVIAAAAVYTTITVSWTYTAVAPITGFKLYRKEGIGGTYALITSPNSGDTSYANSGLDALTTYYYRLDAYNTFFTTASNVPSATTGALDFNFTAMSDGALPAIFTGATWAVASGVAVNTPTLGAEMLTDPGLEGAYTSGKANALTKTGLPTLTESADAHGGSKAQQFEGVAIANAVYWAAAAAVAGTWYQFSIWGKRTAGTNNNVGMGIYLNAAQPADAPLRNITSATYAQRKTSIIATSTDNAFRYAARQLDANASDTVIVDDGSYKVITRSTLYTLLETNQADITAKVQPSAIVDGTLFGLVVRASAVTDPANCIFVLLRHHESISTIFYVSVVKKIGTTYTRVLNETTTTIVSGAWLEARMSDSTVQIFYNDVQRGGNLTIADAELVDNTKHGMFSTGGNSFDGFYAGDLEAMTQHYAGTSFTNAFAGYRPIAQAWQLANLPKYDFTFANYALDGHSTWSNLVRLTTGADLFVIDHANDGEEPFERMSMEALIRRLWTANPATRIIIISSPTWVTLDTSDNAVVNTPKNQVSLEEIETLAGHYGIPIVDYWGWCQANVPAPYDLTDLTADTIHPTLLGYQNMAALLEAYLPTGGGAKPATLPARLYDNGDYENTPTRTLGTGNAGTTGTWATTGTRIESSTAGSTVTFAATCQSFGIYRSDGGSYANLEYSVDGGGSWANMVLYQNGTAIPGGRAAYNVIIRIKAGGSARIEEFWAV